MPTEPLTKEEIDQMEQAVNIIFGGCAPMPYFDRLCYTARLGAEFVKQTSEADNQRG